MSRPQAPRRDERADALDVRARFLTAITEHLAPHRIAELHLFPPIRQGGLETGIAVVAAYPDRPEEAGATFGAPPEHHDATAAPDTPQPSAADGTVVSRAERGRADSRLTVYRATYRWVRKGPERGKWEVDVRAEADAPLATVEDIVRGVHRRAGGEAEPERLSADAVRAAVAERPWTSPT